MDIVLQDLNCTVEWGRLGFRDSWRRTPSSILQRLLRSWYLPGVGGPLYARLRAGRAGSGCGGGGSSMRRGLLARLDDSMDEDQSALDDPYSECYSRDVSTGASRGGGTDVLLAAAAPGSALDAAAELEASCGAEAVSAGVADGLTVQEVADAAAGGSFRTVADRRDQLWLPRSQPQPSAAAGTGSAGADAGTPPKAAPAQQRHVVGCVREAAAPSTSSCDRSGSSIDAKGQTALRDGGGSSAHNSNGRGSPAQWRQPDAPCSQAADAHQWHGARQQWPISTGSGAVPCTASYDERWSE